MGWGALAAAAIGYLSSQDSADAASNAANTSAQSGKYAADVQKQIFDQQRADQLPWLQTGNAALNKLASLYGVSPYGNLTREQLKQQLLPQYTHGGATPIGGRTANGFPISPVIYTNADGSNNVDDAGLNAAIDKALAAQKAQNADPSFGSLTRNFTMADRDADPVYQSGLQFGLNEGIKGLNRQAAASGNMLSGATLKALTRYANDYGTTKAEGAYNRFVTNQTNTGNKLASLAGVGQTASNALAQGGQNYANSVGNIAMTSGANQGDALLAGAQARASGYQGIANSLGKVDWKNLFSSNNDDYANQVKSSGYF